MPCRAPSVAAAPAVVALALPFLLAAAAGCGGQDLPAGEIEGPGRSQAQVEGVTRARAAAAASLAARSGGAAPVKRVLFGDLHVHTSYSIDTYVYSLPPFGGEGVHPPADACDFARYCAGLDFFSINDHAEALLPDRWRATIESIRECNARAGDPEDPDLVAYVGWEWTQVGKTPDTHYGHKNVIYPGLADDELPARPINSLPDDIMDRAAGAEAIAIVEALPNVGFTGYADFLWWMRRIPGTPACQKGVDTRSLPADCRENAETPADLFERLRQWQLPTLVVPHGLAWGAHAPPGSSIDNQLTAADHDPEMQRLLEVFSGHGSSEEFRAGRDGLRDSTGALVCPQPTREHLACCWRAGEIIRERCGDLSDAECTARVEEARALVLQAGTSPHLVIPDSRPEDWLDCDQCRDCFKPASNYRSGESAQVALAVSKPAEGPGAEPLRFRFGLIGSSDNHGARPGTGYKQFARRDMTDARGLVSEGWDDWTRWWIWGRQQDPQRAQPAPEEERGFRGLLDVERGASFMYPGGLVAVHSRDRRRESIWQALLDREVYATSGPRILLWFDLLSAAGGRLPMGSAIETDATPRFEVRAVGSYEPRPGCPEESLAGLSPDRLERLCRGECYFPSDDRRVIAAIEVVRIRPRIESDEDLGALIEDPWRRFECPPDPEGCSVRFEDAEFEAAGRDTVYYVRVLEEPSLAVNGANLRTVFDAAGRAVRTEPCHGGYRTPADDDCLAPVQERAWSSPIFVDRPRSELARRPPVAR